MGAKSSKMNRPYQPIVNVDIENASVIGQPFLRKGKNFPEARNLSAARRPSEINIVSRNALTKARALITARQTTQNIEQRALNMRHRTMKARQNLNALTPIEKAANNLTEVVENTPAIPGIAFSGQRRTVAPLGVKGGKRKTHRKSRKGRRHQK